MQQLFAIFTGICFRRNGPEDLPRSPFLLQVCALLYVLASVAISYAGSNDQVSGRLGFPVALEKGLVDIVFVFVWFAALLMVFKRLKRANQTLIALLGTGVMLTLVALPLVVGFSQVATSSPAALFLSLGLLLLTGWQVTVIGHILHRALDMPLVAGLLFAILYVVTYFAVDRFLFPRLA